MTGVLTPDTMLRSLGDLTGVGIRATDGAIGSVADFLIDDESWNIRYLVVDTGNWLPGRKVLIAPIHLGEPDWAEGSKPQFPVSLTREQIENSPPLDANAPISRCFEEELAAFYHLPLYWEGPSAVSGVGPSAVVPVARTKVAEHLQNMREIAETHLRSVREITGYFIGARDGELGHAEDFILHTAEWRVAYLVIDTRNWWPGGRKVLIAPDWIRSVNWRSSTIEVGLTREQIRNSPTWNPDAPINRDFEGRLYDYYGRHTDWISPTNQAKQH